MKGNLRLGKIYSMEAKAGREITLATIPLKSDSVPADTLKCLLDYSLRNPCN